MVSVHVSDSETDPSYFGRLLDALEMVTDSSLAASYREAARVIGAPPSTAHRLLTLLAARGYCERAEDGTFKMGPRLIAIGVQALAQLPEWPSARALVEELGETTGESASVGILLGDEVVLIARHNSANSLAAVARVGDVMPPHRTAMGKVIMALSDQATRKRLVARFEPQKVDSVLRSLAKELRDTKARGYSIDEEAFTPGMRCRAVPLLDHNSALMGSISISGPAARFSPAQAEASVALLQRAAKQLLGLDPK